MLIKEHPIYDTLNKEGKGMDRICHGMSPSIASQASYACKIGYIKNNMVVAVESFA